MKKFSKYLVPSLILSLLLGSLSFVPFVKAAAPTGTLTGTALTVNIGQIAAINQLTVTNGFPGDIVAGVQILGIQIPNNVNAIWDVKDTSPTFGGAGAAKVDPAVVYAGNKTVFITVTKTFNGDDNINLNTVDGGAGNFIKTTAAANTFVYGQDGLYVDVDNDGGISNNDRRLAVGDTVAEGSGYDAGSLVVCPGDNDCAAGPSVLNTVDGGAGNFIKTTAAANTFVYGQDGLYVDTDGGGKVTNNDRRLAVGNVAAEGSDYTAGSLVARDTLTIAGLSIIGHTSVSAPFALDWTVDNGATYVAGNANTAITVANGTQDTLTNVTITPTNTVVSAQTNYTVAFTVPDGGVIPYNGIIVLTFPAGFDLTAPVTLGAVTGIDSNINLGLAGQVVTLTRDGNGTNSLTGEKTIVLNSITNHNTANSNYTVAAATQATGALPLAGANSDQFSINPAAITNLACTPSGTPGAIYLTWIVPAGTTGGVEVKHSLANIANNNDYNAATTYAQTWANGVVTGQKQELVQNLIPNTTYFFNVKAKGANASISAISNTGIYCAAPAGSSTTSAATQAANTNPSSSITSPSANASIESTEKILIKGASSETGATSIKEVWVSTDGGANWAKATAVKSNTSKGFDWEYEWKNAAEGPHLIKTKATNWLGKTETPGAGITVTITAKPGTVYVTTTTTTSAGAAELAANVPQPSKPISQMNTTEIKAYVMELQTYLLSLLQQLLNALKAKLGL